MMNTPTNIKILYFSIDLPFAWQLGIPFEMGLGNFKSRLEQHRSMGNKIRNHGKNMYLLHVGSKSSCSADGLLR